MAGSYKELRVWQEAMSLAEMVYENTEGVPRTERFGLTNQLRRAAVSVPSNIAEGKGHRSNPEFVHFLLHARGSLLEVETQLCLAMSLKYIPENKFEALQKQTTSVARSLNALINAVDESRARASSRQRLTTTD
jgi:four helix bundle protein